LSKLSQERWRRVEPILDRALELPPEQRTAFLDQACAGDAVLRMDAEALLDAERRSTEFLEAPAAAFLLAADALPMPARPSNAGTIIGSYRIVRELGAGGMGTVYLAERADGQFDQRVALKLIRGGAASADLVRRFLHERQILARLEHPNVARLLDGGLTPDGAPYFAMEYVDGSPITAYCDALGLPIEARLRLFRAAADAVSYAHRNLVVHRDLKPSNVLVTTGGQVKLLDFGIAKLLEESDDGQQLTRSGLYLLTPDYAAPEQVRGGAITTATDVYALGAVLYELLSGHCPHRFDQHTPAEFARVICEQDPVPPSTAVVVARGAREPTASRGSVAAADRRDIEPRRLRRRLHGDLDNIVMKALRKEPERRYPTVDALLEDIARYETGRPVLARRDSVGYRSWKFARRHRAAVAGAAFVLLSLLGGMTTTSRQARVAALESAKAQQVKDFVLDLFELSDPDLSNGAEITARQLLDRGDQRVSEELAGQPALQAEMLAVLGSIDRKLGLYEEAAARFRRALDLERQLHGPRHPNVAARLHDLGNVEIDRSRLEQAEALHREALALRRDLFRPRAPEVARSMAALANALNARGEYEEAERLQRQALAIDREQLGADHAEVANDLENLATILHDRGDYEAAVAAGRETLALRREILGPDHLETATAMNNLAGYLRRRGDLRAADSLYREVLAFDLRRLGPDHPNTATVTNNLAGVLHEEGEYEEAERLYRQVLDFDRRHFGNDHRYTALVLQNLATVLEDRGAFEESERLMREALAINRAVLGEDHPGVAFTLAALAGVLHESGDLDAAEPLYRESLTRLESNLAEHPRTAAAQVGLGRLLTARGRADQAEPLQRGALRILLASYSEDDRRVVEARHALGESLVAEQRFAEAESVLIASYDRLRQRPDREDLHRDAALALATLYQAWNRPDRAEEFRVIARR
jgi:serine/threonine-protein kinase